jgi:MFS transporter, DHA2 family, multidrug resistance protein
MTQQTGARRWWALGATVLAVLAVVLDVTVLSVALPTLATDLHASSSDLLWFTAGYALPLLIRSALPTLSLRARFIPTSGSAT